MKGCSWITRTYNGKQLYTFCEAHGTDHGQVMVDELREFPLPLFVSAGCENPTTPQAEISPWNRSARRHPYSGERPQWSGYCVTDDCACECHYNEPIDESQLEDLGEPLWH
jgi:hypothetical protein